MLRISLNKQKYFDLKNIQITSQIHEIKNNPTFYNKNDLELNYAYLLEYDTNILFYYETPLEIYLKINKNTPFTPNYVVKYHDKTTDIIIIKEKADLKEYQQKYLHELHTINDFCKINNFNFKILTEDNIYTDKLFNAKFLLYYQDPFLEINYNETVILSEIIKKHKKISISNLIQEASKIKERQAELLYILWYSIANHFFDYDKNSKLNMNSLIWINKL